MLDAANALGSASKAQHQPDQTRLAPDYRFSQRIAEMTCALGSTASLNDIMQAAVCEIQRLLMCDRVIILQDTASAFSTDSLPKLVAEATAGPRF